MNKKNKQQRIKKRTWYKFICLIWYNISNDGPPILIIIFLFLYFFFCILLRLMDIMEWWMMNWESGSKGSIENTWKILSRMRKVTWIYLFMFYFFNTWLAWNLHINLIWLISVWFGLFAIYIYLYPLSTDWLSIGTIIISFLIIFLLSYLLRWQ